MLQDKQAAKEMQLMRIHCHEEEHIEHGATQSHISRQTTNQPLLMPSQDKQHLF